MAFRLKECAAFVVGWLSVCSTFSIFKNKFEAGNTSCDARWFSLPFLRVEGKIAHFASPKTNIKFAQFIIVIIIIRVGASARKNILLFHHKSPAMQRCHDKMIGPSICPIFNATKLKFIRSFLAIPSAEHKFGIEKMIELSNVEDVNLGPAIS